MQTLRTAFDPEHFRREGHRVVNLLADLLASTGKGEGAVLPWTPPRQELAHWERRMAEPSQGVADFLTEFAARSIKLHHPHYMGHQVCAPVPSAALAGLVAELLNNGMAVYEMGPAANALERWIIRQTCTAIGFASGDGFLTSGGTLAALTALLAARTRMLGEESLAHGTDNTSAVIASEEGHYCTARAVQVMGWGRDGLVTVPTDARFKLRVDLLPEALAEAARRGRKPVAVVASACSTSTGSYDDLPAIADFCAQHGLWLHVDGAHGAAVAFCPELRSRIAGIERADSAILDFHKLLLTPALATAVLFRDPSASWAAFHQRAQYLFAENESDPWRDSGRRTMECTKLSMSVKIAAAWRAHGPELFAEHLRTVHALARDFADLLRRRPPFEVAVEPESNIVCFRLRPPGLNEAEVDALNANARRRVIESGGFYIVQTTLRGRVWLRTALMNPFTTLAHLDAMLDAVGKG
jgi:L-2,4-diaminobutyrate decarboxylase